MNEQAAIEFELERLRSRVAALTIALTRRSEELRIIQRHACPRDSLVITRVLAGFPPRSPRPYDIYSWNESVELEAAGVEQTMTDLWDLTVPEWSRRDR